MFCAVNAFGEPDPVARFAGAKWSGGSLRLHISSSLFEKSSIKPQSDVSAAIARAIARWQAVADVSIVTTASDRQSVSPAGLRGDGVSLITVAATPENVLLFGSDTSIAAKSRLFVDARGNITEADIVLSPFVQFSTDGSFGTFDLETVLTHEIGHALGLRHSPSLGSLMYENVEPNGSFIGAFRRRELSLEDVAAVRSLYGVREDVEDCCGSAVVRVSGPKDLSRAIIVAQDTHGRVVGTAAASQQREFNLTGLSTGRYELYLTDPKHLFADRNLGAVSIERGETATFTGRVKLQSRPVDIEFVGDKGFLGTASVSIPAGSSATLLVGGRDVAADIVDYFTSAAAVTIDPDSVTNVDYSEELQAVSLRVVVSENAKPGSYSIFARSRNGAVSMLPGAVVVTR
jgi:hypothetical protein